ncbi:hypothetical protein B0H15DRAFT_787211 [Mycena belliarum]|uniref:Uncharacterized protein n=1 Tax=Mycena belliarum TaxID=1033014 RepID=A0AAD6TY79_9AGAR|nr:hypothetical protein B0H15DRAFT_787211 [Mycena belliae]
MLTSALAQSEDGDQVESDSGDSDELDPNDDGLDDDDDECCDLEGLEGSLYRPYPNKTIMLADVLDNLPRCRFTSTQLSVVLRFAKCLGAPNVPTLKGLRKVQKTLQSTCGSEPLRIKSFLGNIFHVNDIREIIARDFSNPLVASKLHLYAEEVAPGVPISETWQAERWKEFSPSQLTPMFSRGLKHFWIEELAQLKSGDFVIPVNLIMREGILTSDAFVVTRTTGGCWHCTEELVNVAADELELDYNNILTVFGPDLVWTASSAVPPMPNPLRKLVDDDEDLVVVMVTPWADDVSGNRSKQYNKHMNLYAQNGCLPGRLLQQEFHVRYMSTSPHASSAEQFAAFRDQIESTETDPVPCYNSYTKKKCRVILRAPGLPADNPQQSEEASHMGSNANYPCRKCKWGGTTIEKTTEDIYHACHLPGIQRSASEIRESLQEQLRLATLGDSNAIKAKQTNSGTKDKVTQYWIEQILARVALIRDEEPQCSPNEVAARVQVWLDEQPGDKMNPLLAIAGLDPSQDTPVELLHTILLGVIKYIWHMMNTQRWSDSDRYLLAIRLQSTDISGLTVPPLRASYMIQYRNNLIGKHFKTLMQTLAFHVHDISTPEQFKLIKAAGELGVRLWIPEIDDMEEYITDLTTAIANLLDAFDMVDPLRILVKIKLHLLAHIPEDIRRFGPAIRSSTEIFEKFNGVFRLCSINSNRLAPSRDISRKFASMERVKHLLCGGYWFDQRLKTWVQAASSVKELLVNDHVLQRQLGWVSSHTETGLIRFASLKKEPLVCWQTTRASSYWNPDLGAQPAPDSKWRLGLSVIAKHGDLVTRLAWVYALGPDGKYLLGRVAEILSGSKSVVTLERFMCTETVHPDFGWPVVRRPTGTEITHHNIGSYITITVSAIQFVCSVQHDCRKERCKPAVMGKERQEREDTDRDRSLIKHGDDDHFVLSLIALHNYERLRRVLPGSLTKLQPLKPEREVFHHEAATKAQLLRVAKREKTAQKRRATAAEKKKQAEKAVAVAEAAALAAQQVEAGEGDVDDTDHSDVESQEDDLEQELDSEERLHLRSPRRSSSWRGHGG